jgi:hypothetical protein
MSHAWSKSSGQVTAEHRTDHTSPLQIVENDKDECIAKRFVSAPARIALYTVV